MRQKEKTKSEKQIARGTVNRESWLEFLELHIRRDEKKVLLLNGFQLGETPKRTLYRWRHEGANTSWYMADAFLCIGGLIWTDFELWCELEKKPLWEKEPPEDWD